LSEREILVPDLGGFKDVLIIDVLVKPGDRVGADTPLLTLETEKATMDVPAGAAGVITRLLVKNGGSVSEGTAIAVLKTDSEDAPAPAAADAQSAPVATAPAGHSQPEGLDFSGAACCLSCSKGSSTELLLPALSIGRMPGHGNLHGTKVWPTPVLSDIAVCAGGHYP
jgi:pyruvate dehydrogenase E2 component (dihydrolipoamide acetyltransferase)